MMSTVAGMADDLHIQRDTTFEDSADELWPLVGTAEGWQQWLVDTADVEIGDGAEGVVVDDGVVRHVQVTHVLDREVAFRWWERDEPSSVSEVVIRVEPLQLGGSRLRISERLLCATDQAAVGRAWDMRLCVLSLSLLIALPMPVSALVCA
jgi:hypothetical protein